MLFQKILLLAELHAVLKTSVTTLCAYFSENSVLQWGQWRWLKFWGWWDVHIPIQVLLRFTASNFCFEKKKKTNLTFTFYWSVFLLPLIIHKGHSCHSTLTIIFMFSLWNKAITLVMKERKPGEKSQQDMDKFFPFAFGVSS